MKSGKGEFYSFFFPLVRSHVQSRAKHRREQELRNPGRTSQHQLTPKRNAYSRTDLGSGERETALAL